MADNENTLPNIDDLPLSEPSLFFNQKPNIEMARVKFQEITKGGGHCRLVHLLLSAVCGICRGAGNSGFHQTPLTSLSCTHWLGSAYLSYRIFGRLFFQTLIHSYSKKGIPCHLK